MATQLKHTDFTYSRPTPPPNVRVAFIAGEAAVAVNDAKLPDTTLEELSIRSETEALIAAAREHLSPRMYDAFLRWGDKAALSCIRNDDQDEAIEQTSSACDEVRRVGATDAQNTHDTLFKTYLLALEAADCPSVGPLRIDPDHASGYVVEGVVTGLTGDLTFFSPVCRMIDDLGRRAWEASESRMALTAEVGGAVATAFSDARAGKPISTTGYGAYMRGPLIQWQKAYAVYEQTDAELSAFDRDVHTPAADKWTALNKRAEGGDTDANLPAALENARLALDVAQDGYDVLVSARGDAIDTLLTLPAPSASELAIKLRLYRDAYTWSGGGAEREAIDAITIDARRFGRHGAHLQTDEALLTAYADRRRVFEEQPRPDKSSQQEDDVYFAAIDASEDVLLKTNATTLEGVLAKLRVAFLNQVGESWSDLAASDTSQPAFIDGLRMSDMHTRMAWSAIEDLARIGGVSFPEQGR